MYRDTHTPFNKFWSDAYLTAWLHGLMQKENFCLARVHERPIKLRLNSEGQFLLTMEIRFVFQGNWSRLRLMQAGAALSERRLLSQCTSGFSFVIQEESSLLKYVFIRQAEMLLCITSSLCCNSTDPDRSVFRKRMLLKIT